MEHTANCVRSCCWIGWDFRSQYGRLRLIANNSRFLILPDVLRIPWLIGLLGFLRHPNRCSFSPAAIAPAPRLT